VSTHITLEDGRVLGTSNGTFYSIIEFIAAELQRGPDRLSGLAEWLLEQRCEVLGPGVGYIDLRELSPRAACEFRNAFIAAYAAVFDAVSDALRAQFTLLRDMWDSIARGEPPQALTSSVWLLAAPSGRRRGPGW